MRCMHTGVCFVWLRASVALCPEEQDLCGICVVFVAAVPRRAGFVWDLCCICCAVPRRAVRCGICVVFVAAVPRRAAAGDAQQSIIVSARLTHRLSRPPGFAYGSLCGRKQCYVDASSAMWTQAVLCGRKQPYVDASSPMWTQAVLCGRKQPYVDASSPMWTQAAPHVVWIAIKYESRAGWAHSGVSMECDSDECQAGSAGLRYVATERVHGEREGTYEGSCCKLKEGRLRGVEGVSGNGLCDMHAAGKSVGGCKSIGGCKSRMKA
eukprot:355187-Chlamydomonas_euryale.AAC.5